MDFWLSTACNHLCLVLPLPCVTQLNVSVHPHRTNPLLRLSNPPTSFPLTLSRILPASQDERRRDQKELDGVMKGFPWKRVAKPDVKGCSTRVER